MDNNNKKHTSECRDQVQMLPVEERVAFLLQFHRGNSKEDVEVEEEDQKSVPLDVCAGSFTDTQYPTPPFLDEQEPDDLPRPEEDLEPEDTITHWCPMCAKSPCVFLEWQEELERPVNIMYPEVSNKAKRYHMYLHMSAKLDGHMGKGKCLPSCVSQGLRDLFPSEEYVGFKPDHYESGARDERNEST